MLAHLQDETKTEDRPTGVISDSPIDLSSLIPTVRAVAVLTEAHAEDEPFAVVMSDRLQFSARVISDGTLRLLALLAILNGATGGVHRHGLPAEAVAAEALADPKGLLDSVVAGFGRRGRRRDPSTVFARIAQEQRIEALRESRSFREFETGLRRALASLGCLSRPK